MPHYGWNRALRGGSYIANDTAGGPPLPDTRVTLQQLRQQGRLSEPTHGPSTENQGSVNGALGQAVTNGKTGAASETEIEKKQPKISANGLVKGRSGQEVVNCDMPTSDSIRESSQRLQRYQKPKDEAPMTGSGPSPRTYLVSQGMAGKAQMQPRAEPELNNDYGKKSDPRLPREHPGQMIADMQSGKPNFGQPGSTRHKHVPWDYKPTRASGLSAALQTQHATETGPEAKTVSSNGPPGHPNPDRFISISPSTANWKASGRAAPTNQTNRTPSSHQQASSCHENRSVSALLDSDEICCVCRKVYLWEDEKIFPKCCDMAIGSQCRDQHIAQYGKCYNCDEEELQSEAASEAETWVSYDPEEFDKETPDLPLYAAHLSGTDPGRRHARASLPQLFAGNSALTKQTPLQNGINPSNVNPTRSSQPLFVSRTKEECDREAINHTWNGNSQSTSYNEVINDSAETKTIPSANQVATYNESVYAPSESSEDYQQASEGSVREDCTSQKSREYLLGATERLVKVFEFYGDQVTGKDKDQTVDGILKLLTCKPFQALVNKRLLETASEPQPTPTQAGKPSHVLDPKSSSSEASCKKCEAAEAKIVEAMNVLRGP